MPKVLNFYMDDSGTRHPDRPGTSGSATRDWFALGGVLIKESDEAETRHRFNQFASKWQISYPFHSADIRHHADKFRWLQTATDEERERFMNELTDFLLHVPAIGLACVIDRPGTTNAIAKSTAETGGRFAEPPSQSRWSGRRSTQQPSAIASTCTLKDATQRMIEGSRSTSVN